MSELQQIAYLSRLDGTMQPALFCRAKGQEPRPLAVCLHTWSYGIEPPYEHFLVRCKERNWHFIYPLFRGANNTPEACGSDLVVSDLECAVEYVRKTVPLDESRIYLVGGSGGGHAALLMAGRRPELWTAVSAWCPITDIAKWAVEIVPMKDHPDDQSYDFDIMAACGGDPTKDPAAAEQAKRRSPLTWLPQARGKGIVEIATGIHDGHRGWGGVPVSHAINAFNALTAEADCISQADIDYIVKNEQIPELLRFTGVDSAFGENRVLFRRISGMVRLTLFDGGHSILPGPAFGFLEQQRRGHAPVWNSGSKLDVKNFELTK